MLNPKINVYLNDNSVRTYAVIKILKQADNMIKFIGVDTSGEVALVIAEKSNKGKYEVATTFDIPIFGMNNDDD